MAQGHQQDAVIMEVSVSAPRRIFALGILVCLGALLVWLGVQAQGVAFWPRLVFFGTAAVMLLLAWRMWQATQAGLVLTEDGISDTNGTLLAPFDAIRRVERGFFAFKPSNGFLLHMTTRQSRVWRPGLWWRMGRRVGVGGVCNGSQTRAMADILAIRLAQVGRGDG